jgi:hypothetical protein
LFEILDLGIWDFWIPDCGSYDAEVEDKGEYYGEYSNKGSGLDGQSVHLSFDGLSKTQVWL